ncbi:MAG: hypothetical protein HYY96_17830 [Candidatus Tectomicrobia bacterium]|nr:hypothetical protein [Candidatus Tectomicrobia bacterium]
MNMMADIFWVQCPKCQGRWYCEGDMKGVSNVVCPFCLHDFPQEESLEKVK